MKTKEELSLQEIKKLEEIFTIRDGEDKKLDKSKLSALSLSQEARVVRIIMDYWYGDAYKKDRNN